MIHRDLVLETPVDTGRARSNWIVTSGRESYSTREPLEVRSAQTVGQAEIQATPQFATIHIQNNLPYIARLNDGWSAQAPRGFVQTIVERARQWIGRQGLRLR